MSFEGDLNREVPIEHLISLALAKVWRGFVVPQPATTEGDGAILVRQQFQAKSDYKSQTTNNLYFEMFNSRQNKPSGLGIVPDRFYWVHGIPHLNELLVFDSGWLKSRLDAPDMQGFATRPFGGDRNSEGYAVPIRIVKGWNVAVVVPFKYPKVGGLEASA